MAPSAAKHPHVDLALPLDEDDLVRGGLSHVWTPTQLCSHPGIISLMGTLGFFHGFS